MGLLKVVRFQIDESGQAMDMARTSSLRELLARTFDRITHPSLEGDADDSASLIESGDFRINLATRTAELGGEELQLTAE